METLASPTLEETLRTIDEAISDRLADRAEAERKRLDAEAEKARLIELGKEAFVQALAQTVARQYGLDIRGTLGEIEYSYDSASGPAYHFRLVVKAEPVAEGVNVEAWVSYKWAKSAQEMQRDVPRDRVWVARRRALFDGPEEGPVTLCAEFSDLVDALVWARLRE